jgi:hypothetical protein
MVLNPSRDRNGVPVLASIKHIDNRQSRFKRKFRRLPDRPAGA